MIKIRGSRIGRRSARLGSALAAGLAAVLVCLNSPAGAAPSGPNLSRATAYLVAPATLIDGHYYELFPGFADWGLTIDGAFALAATGDNDTALKKITAFLAANGADSGGNTASGNFTFIGTEFVSGGSLAKEALLAQVTGYDAHAFGGQDLLAALDASICTAASPAPDGPCAAPGNYSNSTSVFSQSLGVIAQLRAGSTAAAAAPIAYLESLQAVTGAWPSLIPSTGNADVDSTAMAVMALAMVDTPAARTAVANGIAWIAGRQSATGGLPGTAADSVNSTALAIQALSLDQTTYVDQIAAAQAFLATQQNPDGGFNTDPTSAGTSDVRASAQAVGGSVATSFATLTRDISALPDPSPSASASVPPPRPTTPAGVAATRTPLPVSSGGGVDAASTTAGAVTAQLANTGARVGGQLVVAVLLVAGGGLIVLTGRRPRPVGRHR